MTTEARTRTERQAPPINEITALLNLIRTWATQSDAEKHRPPRNVELTLQLNHDRELLTKKRIPLSRWIKPYYESKAEAKAKAISKTKSEAEINADLHYFATHAVGNLKELRNYPQYSADLANPEEKYKEICTQIDLEIEYLSQMMTELNIKPKTHPNFVRHLGYSLVDHARSLAKKGWVDTRNEPSILAIIRLFKEGQRMVRAAEKVDPRHTEVLFSPGDEFIL